MAIFTHSYAWCKESNIKRCRGETESQCTGRCQGWALTTAVHHMCIQTRSCKYSLKLLMMSGVPLKTCWASIKIWNNKFYYKVASCWLFLLIRLWVSRTHQYGIWNPLSIPLNVLLGSLHPPTHPPLPQSNVNLPLISHLASMSWKRELQFTVLHAFLRYTANIL
jgi:hypothetical protein